MLSKGPNGPTLRCQGPSFGIELTARWAEKQQLRIWLECIHFM